MNRMTAYDLNRVNDKEFEALAVRIVQELIGTRVERFKPGKDAGVDGRFFVVGATEGIVQAKHWGTFGIGASSCLSCENRSAEGRETQAGSLSSRDVRAAVAGKQTGDQRHLRALSSVGGRHLRARRHSGFLARSPQRSAAALQAVARQRRSPSPDLQRTDHRP